MLVHGDYWPVMDVRMNLISFFSRIPMLSDDGLG